MKVERKFTKSAKDGLEIYKKLLDEKNAIFHIIFVNIEMPEMNGVQFCKEIRENESKNLIKKTYLIAMKDNDDPEL